MPDEPITLRDIIEIERKVKEQGGDSLEPWELDALMKFQKVVLPFHEKQPDVTEAFKIVGKLSPEERERYRDWTVDQLSVLKPLIDERGMPEA